jgi:hypothetical protein
VLKYANMNIMRLSMIKNVNFLKESDFIVSMINMVRG